METPRNLNEYRAERIETIKRRLSDVANEHLLERTDGAFVATFGETSVNELELYIINDTFDGRFTAAPERVVTEVAIDIANELAQDDSLPYTIDMSTLHNNPRYIRIVKM